MEKLDSNDVYTYEPCYSSDELSDLQGAQVWLKNGAFHRDGDQPAIVYPYGERRWCKDGELHRDGDQPAVLSDYVSEWHSHGVSHRENGEPAVIVRYQTRDDEWMNCLKVYRVHGKLHRDNDLPAVDGVAKTWYVNGVRHRETVDSEGLLLPAFVHMEDYKYYLNGVEVDRHGVPLD